MAKRLLPSLIAYLTCVPTACGDGPVQPRSADVAVLRLNPDALLFEPNESRSLTATAYDADGSIVPDGRVAWTTSDAAIATVDGAGRVTAHGPGSVDIVARVGAIDATASIGVLSGADEEQVCGGARTSIAIIVEAELAALVRTRLTRLEQDLCAAGYAVNELRSRLRHAGEIRAWLVRERTRTAGALEGVILVGDLPHAYQWITLHSSNPDIPSTSEEAISFQYYADLDGVFGASLTYESEHRHSYDLRDGDLDWEIWVGVLPVQPGGPAATADAINAYLDRNHAWRTGGSRPPRAFLQVSEHFTANDELEYALLIQAMRTGIYAWTAFSEGPDAHLYFNSPPLGISVRDGYDALEAGVADFTVLDAHGSYRQSGLLDLAWARSQPIATTFFWSNGCAVGNLDYPENFLSAVLYGPRSQVLVAKGTTNNSGGMGTNGNGFFGHNIAAAMTDGASIGQALVAHVNVPLIHPWSTSREFHFATAVLLGDPTLGLPD